MPQEIPVPGDPQAYTKFVHARGAALRDKDLPPTTLAQWSQRRALLRENLLQAMGTYEGPALPPGGLMEVKELGVLKRDGYRIEKLLLTTLPGVQATCSLYVPEPLAGKAPAVLVVHGHWAWARRDPVVQARCLGLVKLGFVVLAIDACGAGERHPQPERGSYHGAQVGSTLWPTGWSLLGVQVHENRRALDYLQARPEVDPKKLGVTGASGGGNQSMYVGAVDDRLGCVVPVCSVGTYQAYLRAACCICEVLPGALSFTEEGDVLGLVAPRALLVVNATKDGFQFSVGEAKKSLERAREIFKLNGAGDKLAHAVFEAGHGYDKAMREAMYGFLTRWLKGEGEGKPIPEPKFTEETPEALACFAPGERPGDYTTPPRLARATAVRLLEPLSRIKLDHREAWDATAATMKAALVKALGELPPRPRPVARFGKVETDGPVRTTPFDLTSEGGLTLPGLQRVRTGRPGPEGMPEGRIALVLHFDGRNEAVKQPLSAALVQEGVTTLAVDLRATGSNKPAGDTIRTAVDHNSAEHGLWLGRPLLGQWVFDVGCILDWLALQPGRREGVILVGYGVAGLLALSAGAIFADRVSGVACVDMPTSLVTDREYPAAVRLGLLAPGLFRAGDIPHLAALIAPRPLLINGGTDLDGGLRIERLLRESYGFTERVYATLKAGERLLVREPQPAANAARWLLGLKG